MRRTSRRSAGRRWARSTRRPVGSTARSTRSGRVSMRSTATATARRGSSPPSTRCSTVRRAVPVEGVPAASSVDDDGMSWLAGSAWGVRLSVAAPRSRAPVRTSSPADTEHTDQGLTGARPSDPDLLTGDRPSAASTAGPLDGRSPAAEQTQRAGALGEAPGSPSDETSPWSVGVWSNGSRRSGGEPSGRDEASAGGTTDRETRVAGSGNNGSGSPTTGRARARHAKPEADVPDIEHHAGAPETGGRSGRRRAAAAEPADAEQAGIAENPARADRTGPTSRPAESAADGPGRERPSGPPGRAVAVPSEPPLDDSEISWPGLRWWAAGRAAAQPAERADDPARVDSTGRRDAAPGQAGSDTAGRGAERVDASARGGRAARRAALGAAGSGHCRVGRRRSRCRRRHGPCGRCWRRRRGWSATRTTRAGRVGRWPAWTWPRQPYRRERRSRGARAGGRRTTLRRAMTARRCRPRRPSRRPPPRARSEPGRTTPDGAVAGAESGEDRGEGGRRRRAPEPTDIGSKRTARIDDDPLSPGWTGMPDRELTDNGFAAAGPGPDEPDEGSRRARRRQR